MIGNIQQGLGKAKNISIIDFNNIEEYNEWSNSHPIYILYDIKIITAKSNSMYPYKIVVIYLKVNE